VGGTSGNGSSMQMVGSVHRLHEQVKAKTRSKDSLSESLNSDIGVN